MICQNAIFPGSPFPLSKSTILGLFSIFGVEGRGGFVADSIRFIDFEDELRPHFLDSTMTKVTLYLSEGFFWQNCTFFAFNRLDLRKTLFQDQLSR